MSEQVDRSEIAQHISWRLSGLEGTNSLWSFISCAQCLKDNSSNIPMMRMVNHTRYRFVASNLSDVRLGPLVVHFDDFHGTLARVQGMRIPPSPTDIHFTFFPADMTEQDITQLTFGELFSTPALVRISYGDSEGLNAYDKSMDKIVLSGPDNSDGAVIVNPASYITNPRRPPYPLSEKSELYSPYSSQPWSTRFEVNPDSVGFSLCFQDTYMPFVIPRRLTVRST